MQLISLLTCQDKHLPEERLLPSSNVKRSPANRRRIRPRAANFATEPALHHQSSGMIGDVAVNRVSGVPNWKLLLSHALCDLFVVNRSIVVLRLTSARQVSDNGSRARQIQRLAVISCRELVELGKLSRA